MRPAGAAQTAFSSQAKLCSDDYFKVDIGCTKSNGDYYDTLEHPEYVQWNAAGSLCDSMDWSNVPDSLCSF